MKENNVMTKFVNSNSFHELVTTFGEMYDRNVKGTSKLAFLFNFHLDCGKHFATFSKQIEIAQICIEGKTPVTLALAYKPNARRAC